jgi:cell division protein FtsB
MQEFLTVLKHPFTLGLLLGLLFFAIAIYHLIHSKIELARFRRHLSDKLELEAKNLQDLRKETERLTRENENLRIKTAQVSSEPAHKIERELELLARAERHMNLNAPGFAAAWETAKSQALADIQEEERGNTLPKKLFRKFFGSSEVREIAAETSLDSSPGGNQPSSQES